MIPARFSNDSVLPRLVLAPAFGDLITRLHFLERRQSLKRRDVVIRVAQGAIQNVARRTVRLSELLVEIKRLLVYPEDIEGRHVDIARL